MTNGKNIIAASIPGWVMFAGVIMIIVGLLHAIAGMVAIFQPDLYVTTEDNTLLFSYAQWGWVHFILGLVAIGAASSLFAGKFWGRFVAIVLASVSIVVNFGFMWAYPIWSILVIAIDFMIIYAVAMYSGQDEANA